ncbi:hypothetical protein [Roseovarius ramblicola]|uniref:Transcriptional regulator n=1 Tax=Roseovarius ramblicola TaxID=2022336 RepID=A0ABV5HZY7_9RHOB
MPREPTRESDERLLRVLDARRRGVPLRAVAEAEGLSVGYLGKMLTAVRDDDAAHVDPAHRRAVFRSYSKGGAPCPEA